MKEYPTKIYLQSEDEYEFRYSGDTTWCEDKVNDCDKCYVLLQEVIKMLENTEHVDHTHGDMINRDELLDEIRKRFKDE